MDDAGGQILFIFEKKKKYLRDKLAEAIETNLAVFRVHARVGVFGVVGRFLAQSRNAAYDVLCGDCT